MELKELIDLIQIRQYVVSTMGNSTFSKSVVKQMSNTLLLLDKKIVELITREDFQSYIGVANVNQVISDVVRTTNIKFGLPK